MAALTSIRATVKNTLVGLLQDALPGIQVSRAYPQTLEKEAVFLGNVSGRQDPAAIAATRVRRDDTFSIDVIFVVNTEGNDPTEAEDRCETLFAALEEILATTPRLGLATDSGLLWARVGDVDGPQSEPATEGYDAGIRAEIVCRTRLT